MERMSGADDASESASTSGRPPPGGRHNPGGSPGSRWRARGGAARVLAALGALQLVARRAHAKGLVGKLPGNPASCPEEPCNSDPQHVLYALKWTSLGFGLILLLPLLMYYMSKLFSKLRQMCLGGKPAPADKDKQAAAKQQCQGRPGSAGSNQSGSQAEGRKWHCGQDEAGKRQSAVSLAAGRRSVHMVAGQLGEGPLDKGAAGLPVFEQQPKTPNGTNKSQPGEPDALWAHDNDHDHLGPLDHLDHDDDDDESAADEVQLALAAAQRQLSRQLADHQLRIGSNGLAAPASSPRAPDDARPPAPGDGAPASGCRPFDEAARGSRASNGSPAPYELPRNRRQRYSLFMESALAGQQQRQRSPGDTNDRDKPQTADADERRRYSLRNRPGSGRRAPTHKIYPAHLAELSAAQLGLLGRGRADQAPSAQLAGRPDVGGTRKQSRHYLQNQSTGTSAAPMEEAGAHYAAPKSAGPLLGRLALVDDLYQHQHQPHSDQHQHHQPDLANTLTVPILGPQHRHSIDGSILNNMVHGMQPGRGQVNNASDNDNDNKPDQHPGIKVVHQHPEPPLVPLDLGAIRRANKRRQEEQNRQQWELFRLHQLRLAEYQHFGDGPPVARGLDGAELVQLAGRRDPERQDQPEAGAGRYRANGPGLLLQPVHHHQRDRRPSLNAAALGHQQPVASRGARP